MVGEPPRFSFAERVAAASAAGFSGIGLHWDDYASMRDRGTTDAELLAILDKHSMRVAEIEFLWNWAYEDGDRAQESREMEARLYAMADAFEPHHLNVGDINMAEDLPPLDVVTERFAAVCDRAAEHGVEVALEFLPWSGIPDLATALAVVTAAKRANGGVIVDSWHYFRGRPDDALLRSAAAQHIKCVQLSDGDAEPDGDYMSDTILHRRLPGDGAFDLLGLLQCLGENNDAAVSCSVEIMSTDEQALPVGDIARRAYDATASVVARARGGE
jgi:sugar phosphate isomerase/epimerase